MWTLMFIFFFGAIVGAVPAFVIAQEIYYWKGKNDGGLLCQHMVMQRAKEHKITNAWRKLFQ